MLMDRIFLLKEYLWIPLHLFARESITVNNVTYDDCIKVVSGSGTGSVDWYCAGFGLVKQMSVSSIWELTAVVAP
ncbi:MAG: hypothetical protein AMJ55_05635 [Gammaproteobacteria bacterium SG8_15]|nr:MAG: hypothetical protein AMJ55_05635 [Gammaproteobacteria bacterium SG8_15]